MNVLHVGYVSRVILELLLIFGGGNLNNNRKMIQFDRIRRSSVVRDKVYYLCNQIKFYSIKDPLVTALYFLTQSLALISTFIASPLAGSTYTDSALQAINSIFFFFTNDLYVRHDAELIPSHFISLLLFLGFVLIGYFTYTLDHRNHLIINKSDRKKIKLIEVVVSVVVTFSIPLGSFMWYYIIRLFQANMQYLVVFSLFTLACIFFLVYVVEQCSIESDLKNYKSLSRLYSKNQSIHSIVKMMVRMIIASFNKLTSSVIILSLLALLVFDLYELRVCIISKKFLDPTTEAMYYYKNVATVILEVLMLFCLVTDFPLIVNNFFLSVVSTSLLAYIALAQFKQNKKMNLILDGIDAVTSQDDAKIYMLEMISMLDSSKHKEEIFTLSLITIHRQKCKEDNCFCRSNNFDSYNKLASKGQFLKRFILSKLQSAAKKFASSFLILSILINYKLSMMSSFTKIYYLLKSYTQKNQQALQSFSQQYMLYQVQIIIQKEIHKNNVDQFVEVQKTFQQDELKLELTKLISNVNQSFSEKYKLMGQEICNLNLIDEICLKISNILRKIQAVWIDFQSKDSYNLKIYEIFLIYFEYIMFSKKQASLIKTTITRKTQALQHLKGISEQNIQRYLYTDKACVIQAIFNKDKVGIVTNITSSCLKVFKINRDQIIEKDLHELMPQYFANEHRKWTQQWLDNQVLTGKILGLVKTFFVDGTGNTFSCSLHMKVASVGFKLKFYVMVIKDNACDYLLLNNSLEIQGIGSKLQVQQVFQMGTLKKSIKQYTQTDIQEIADELVENEPIKKRIIFRNESNLDHGQKQMACAILGASSEVCMKQPPQAYVYQCEVSIERHSINRFIYFTLKFFEIRKMTKHNDAFFFKTLTMSKNYDSLLSARRGSKRQIVSATTGLSNHTQTDCMLKSSENDLRSDDDNRFQVHNMSSIAESALGQGNIMFSKLAQQIKEKSVNFQKIQDKRLTFTTIMIVLMIAVVTGSAFLEIYLFQIGIKSYNQIIYASSAVSSNNQLLQSIFNYATNLNTLCNRNQNVSKCEQYLQKSGELTKRVYSYMIDDTRVYLINKTSLTGIRYYSYYDKQVELYLQNVKSSVSVKDFIGYYFYAVKNIQNLVLFRPLYQTNITLLLQFLVDNWQTMKDINDQALLYYQEASQTQFSFLEHMTYFLYGLFLLTLFLFLFLINRYYDYLQNKKQNIIRLHGFLTHPTCSKLRQIGDGVRQCLTKTYVQLQTTLDIQGLRQGKQKSQFRYEKYRKYNYVLLLFFIVMAGLNSFILYQISAIFAPASEMMAELTSLVQAQNIALESYLQTKTIYMFNSTHSSSEKVMDQVMKILDTTQIQFAATARDIQETIKKIGGNYADSFNQLLVKDVCLIASNATSLPTLYQTCQDMNYGILNLGAVTAVNFMIRNVMSGMVKLMNNQANSTIFSNSVFHDIDDYIYYLFKIYKALTNQIMNSVEGISNNINQNISIIVIFEIIILILALIIWIARINTEKKKLSNLYAQVLQLPQIIFRENKIILKILEENLTLKL